MLLQSFKRLFKGDFDQKDQPFVEKFSFFFNNGIETLYNALNKNISLKDNILCTVRDLEVAVFSTGLPKTTTSISVDISGKIIGLNVLKVENLTNSNSYPSSAVFISWTQDNKTIYINHITGLTVNDNYRIKVVAYGE